MSEMVLVIGATLLDTKGKPNAGLEPNTSNPSTIRVTRGGTARNVAENLALLGADVVLISAVGDDMIGHSLKEQTAVSGVNVKNVHVIPKENTGAYIAILDEDGSMNVAMDDVHVMRHISSELLYSKRKLFKKAAFVVFDGSLTSDAMGTIVDLCGQYDVPVVADPSSARLAYKLRPYLSHLHLVAPNETEAIELCQVGVLEDNPDLSLDLARSLVYAGVENAVVTLTDFGLAYATAQETGYVPPNYSKMVDSTGTGDAVTAAIIFGMLNDLPTMQAIRLGAAAGGLTLQTAETVVPNLSLDMLYEHLIV